MLIPRLDYICTSNSISSYTVIVTDKNPAIKLCEYFFTPISWKIDIIAGFTGGK